MKNSTISLDMNLDNITDCKKSFPIGILLVKSEL